MTWISTWPLNNVPQFAAHDTEQEAEAHAAEIVASGKSRVATVFETSTEEAS